MKYTIEFDNPVKPNKALIVLGWMQNIDKLNISEAIKFCRLTKEIGFVVK